MAGQHAAQRDGGDSRDRSEKSQAAPSEIKEKIDNINNQYTEYINQIVDLEKENELMQKNYDIIKNLVSVDSKIENLYYICKLNFYLIAI